MVRIWQEQSSPSLPAPAGAGARQRFGYFRRRWYSIRPHGILNPNSPDGFGMKHGFVNALIDLSARGGRCSTNAACDVQDGMPV